MNVLAELIEPNWHVVLVHFPIALLAIGVMMEVVCGLLGAAGARNAGRWMVLIGAVLSLPVAVSGLYAMQDLARGGEFVNWHAANALSPELWDALSTHAFIQAGSTAVALLSSIVFLASSDGTRRFLYPPLLLLLLLAVGGSTVGSHIAGQAVYRFGLPRPPIAPATLPAEWPERAVYVAPPLQLHATLAGLTISVGLTALALALRNASILSTPAPKPRHEPGTVFPGTGRADQPRDAKVIHLPASRVFLLTTGLGLLAASAGIWHLSGQTQTTVPRELWETVVTFPPADAFKSQNRDLLRRPAHVALGTLLVALPLVLSLCVWLRPRGRFLTVLLGSLWISAAAAQLWVGTLLLWDLPVGPVTGFVQPETK